MKNGTKHEAQSQEYKGAWAKEEETKKTDLYKAMLLLATSTNKQIKTKKSECKTLIM